MHLAIGAIEALINLSPTTRVQYIDTIQALSELLATGDTLSVNGYIPVERDNLVLINISAPLSAMQETARHVGALIVTIKLAALGGHSIQDIETWDDHDESRALVIKQALLAHRPIEWLGDDAQLLAGATIALLENPAQYDIVTRSLNIGLDNSFSRDPIWGSPRIKRIRVGSSVVTASASRSFWPAKNVSKLAAVRYWCR